MTMTAEKPNLALQQPQGLEKLPAPMQTKLREMVGERGEQARMTLAREVYTSLMTKLLTLEGDEADQFALVLLADIGVRFFSKEDFVRVSAALNKIPVGGGAFPAPVPAPNPTPASTLDKQTEPTTQSSKPKTAPAQNFRPTADVGEIFRLSDYSILKHHNAIIFALSDLQTIDKSGRFLPVTQEEYVDAVHKMTGKPAAVMAELLRKDEHAQSAWKSFGLKAGDLSDDLVRAARLHLVAWWVECNAPTTLKDLEDFDQQQEAQFQKPATQPQPATRPAPQPQPTAQPKKWDTYRPVTGPGPSAGRGTPPGPTKKAPPNYPREDRL